MFELGPVAPIVGAIVGALIALGVNYFFVFKRKRLGFWVVRGRNLTESLKPIASVVVEGQARIGISARRQWHRNLAEIGVGLAPENRSPTLIEIVEATVFGAQPPLKTRLTEIAVAALRGAQRKLIVDLPTDDAGGVRKFASHCAGNGQGKPAIHLIGRTSKSPPARM